MKKKYDVIILGSAHQNSLGMIRSLKKSEHDIYYLYYDKTDNFVSKSKYLINSWYVENENEMLNFLKYEFKISRKTIILPSDDFSANFLDKYKISLKEIYLFPYVTNEEYNLEQLMDKQIMTELANESGFNVPKTLLVNILNENINNIESQVSEKIGFPCILKPSKSIYGNKRDISVVYDRNKLRTELNLLKNNYSEIIIQEYINIKNEIGIQGIATLESINFVVAGYVNKLRISENARGSTTYGELKKIDNVHYIIGKIQKLFYLTGFIGIFDVEFLDDGTNLYFLEINFRNGAYGYAFTKSGANLTELLCEYLANNLMDMEKLFFKESTFMSEFSDLKHVINGNLSAKIWIKNLISADTLLIFNSKDIKPFIYKVIYEIKSKKKR